MMQPCVSTEIQIERRVAAPQSVVWRVLIAELTDWWPADFRTRADTRMVLEPKLSGRLFEDGGEKGGLVWFEVMGLEPESRLQLKGLLFPGYGGPAVTMVSISLGPDGGATRVTLTDALVGRLNAKTEESLREGWTLLLGALAKAAEAAAAPP